MANTYSENELEKYLIQVRRIAEHRKAGAEEKIRKIHKDLVEDLNGWLGNSYAKYAEDDILDFAILRQKGQYARFLEEVQEKIDGIYPELKETVEELVSTTYKACYQGMYDGVVKSKKAAELHTAFRKAKGITAEQIKAAVQNPVDKLRLTPTLERNRAQIVSSIKREIAVGLSNGDRMSTMARRMSKCVNGGYKKAMLIVRTEAHRVREAGLNDAANGIDDILKVNNSEYRMVKTWHNMKDDAVRHSGLANHVDMEGQTVLQNEKFTMVSSGAKADHPGASGIAAEDCNCRCFLTTELMTDAEFFAATGRHFTEKTFTNEGKSDIIKDSEVVTIMNTKLTTEIPDSDSENGIIKLKVNMFDKSTPIYLDALNIEEEDGFEDVCLHGSSKLVQAKVNSKLKNFTAKEFAKYLKEETSYKGGNIRLASCSTGKGENSFAQQLSKELGVTVKAPDDDLYYIDDHYFIGSPYRNIGAWRIFKNGDEIK